MALYRYNQGKGKTAYTELKLRRSISKDMKILFDMNNLAMRTLHLPMIEATTSPKWNFWKYLIFSNIYDYVVTEGEFKNPEDDIEVILAYDTKEEYWRASIYPPYKGNRKKDTSIDWTEVFENYNSFLLSLANYTPFTVLGIPGTEADDIIATICLNKQNPDEEYLIYSGDCDYLQLEDETTSIYMPQKDGYVTFPCEVRIAGTKVVCEDVETFKKLSVLTGQGCKDNVYNVKTPTDWDSEDGKKRKPGFGVKAALKAMQAEEGIESYLEKLGSEVPKNYERNKKLIDFKHIPSEIQEDILSQHQEYQKSTFEPVMLFSKYNWQSYLSQADDMKSAIDGLYGFEHTSYIEDEAEEPGEYLDVADDEEDIESFVI